MAKIHANEREKKLFGIAQTVQNHFVATCVVELKEGRKQRFRDKSDIGTFL